MKGDGYSFESFLPYRQALQLARCVSGLLRLEIGFRTGRTHFDETLVSGVGANARGIFPDLKPAEMDDEEFRRTRAREELEDGLKEEEMEDHIERLAQELRDAIDTGEIDIWDDSPRFVEARRVRRFCDDSWGAIKSAMIPSLKPGVGLLGDLVLESAGALDTGGAGALRGYRAALLAWDFARMHHEGEPPYKIVFSNQVAEALGIDPKMESIRAGRMPPASREDKRRMMGALAVVKKETGGWLEPVQKALFLSGVLQ